ncbi:MAG: SMC-Scp complex subunit ScpB [Oscillospiraceae bacterium]|jgi:segregation and condensation protein B|nr:SMC-Scp complex subunit ScpB [Oscillospiraceae bacterium]
MANIEAALEGILFAAGDPIESARIAAVLDVSQAEVLAAADVLARKYEREGRGVRVVRLEDALQMCSAAEFADVIRLALEKGKPPRLSPQSLEALAVVAYFQPVTKAYVEQVRGVDCSNSLHVLQIRGLVERRGHLAVPGRPALYYTTDEFLRTFGLNSLAELPPLPGKDDAPEQIQLVENEEVTEVVEVAET